VHRLTVPFAARHRDSAKQASDAAVRASGVAILGDRAYLREYWSLRAATAIVSLQSAPGHARPDNLFELGAMNLYSVQKASDDLATSIERFEEPVVTLTVRPQQAQP
jgi:hypothetical protein